MTWQSTYIETISNYTKLVIFSVFHNTHIPPFTMLTEPVFTERNRLIVQGNERLKRIEELEADVKNLRMCNNDLRDMVNEAYDKLDKSRLYGTDQAYLVREATVALNAKDKQIDAMVEYIDKLIGD